MFAVMVVVEQDPGWVSDILILVLAESLRKLRVTQVGASVSWEMKVSPLACLAPSKPRHF